MKLPSFETALSVIGSLTGMGPGIAAAEGIVNVVIDLFDGEPDKQEELRSKYELAKAETDAALDRLEEASRPKP